MLNSKELEKSVLATLASTKSKSESLILQESFYEITDALLDSNRIINKSKALIEEMIKYSGEKTNLKVYLREKVKFFCSEIERSEQDIEILIKNYEAQIASNKSLWEAHEKLHKKIRQVENTKNKEREKFCRNCLKWFRDRDNFAWSCKRHVSEWSGQSYWCCGSSIQSAPGCVISYHIEDSNEIKATEVAEDFCITCKHTGHLFNRCPKDPNILHSFKNPKRELDRIFKVRTKAHLKSSKPIKPFINLSKV